MVTVRKSLMAGSALLVALLAALATTVGLGYFGWGVGLACGVVTTVAVARGAAGALGPADLITLSRAVLTCALAALVADSFVHSAAVTTLVALATVALVSDAIDGWVARRTQTSTFGARFDGEVDAFLILVLSVYVADAVHGWVLAIGLARYAFAVAGWVLPWMRRAAAAALLAEGGDRRPGHRRSRWPQLPSYLSGWRRPRWWSRWRC